MLQEEKNTLGKLAVVVNIDMLEAI